jgi:hypothetical protein
MIMSILHPGDLSAGDWLRVLAMGLIFCAAPVVIVALIIYKVFINRGEDDGKSV